MPMLTGQALLNEFSSELTHLHGSLDREISQPVDSDSTAKDTICYLASPSVLSQVDLAATRTAVIHEKLADWAKENIPNWTVFTTKNVILMMALINREFFPANDSAQPFDDHKIHPSAVVHPTAQLGENVSVGPNAVIMAGALIGNSCIIGANTVVEPHAKIGDRTHLFPNVYIGHHCEMGTECEIKPQTTIGTDGFGFAHTSDRDYIRIPHYGKTVLGNNVRIGAGTTIDRGTYENTTIGDGTIMDNHCHIGHNCSFGKKCIITASFVCAGSTHVGDYFVAGGRSSAAGHVNVCDNVQLAANTTITKDIDVPGAYAGFPCVDHKTALKYLVALPSLPEIKRTVAKLKKKCLD